MKIFCRVLQFQMSTFKNLASILLISSCFFFLTAQAQEEHQNQDVSVSNTEGVATTLTNEQVWGFGFLAGFGISLIGFLAAIVLLIAKKCCSLGCFELIIKFFFSLACGALLGDALIHILAQGYDSEDLDSLIISCILICSILLFIILEKVLQSCGVTHEHWAEDDSHEHEHEHEHEEENKHEKKMESAENLKTEEKLQMEESKQKNSKIKSSDQNPQANNQSSEIEEKGNKCKEWCKQYSGKGSAGYMNLIGSLIHNFIDGLALGIAFATGSPTEIVPVLVAIIAHEIPRELGDVAILLKNQFSQIQTVICNGVINLFSLVGVIIGLAIVNLDEVAKSYIMIFVAGNFLFIAADIWRHMFKNKGQYKSRKNILQFFGFATGVGAMFALTLLETEDDH